MSAAAQSTRLNDLDAVMPNSAFSIFHRQYWIVSPKFDLMFFSLSTLITPLLVFWYLGLVSLSGASEATAGMVVYAFFTLFLDAPHIYQTFSRTHLDKTEFNRHRNLHIWLLPFIFLASTIIYFCGFNFELNAFFQFFGAWHILRQNIGFLHLYQRNSPKRLGQIESGLFYLVWFYCLIYIPKIWGSSGTIDDASTILLKEFMAAWPKVYIFMVNSTGLLAILFFFAWIGLSFVHKKRISGPKLIYIFCCLSTYVITFVWLRDHFLITSAALIAFETAYHDLQYHGFVSHFQARRFGVNSFVAKHWLRVCLFISVLVCFIEFGLIQYFEFEDYLYLPVLAVITWHYYIDGLIWRGKTAPELKDVLRKDPQVIFAAGQNS